MKSREKLIWHVFSWLPITRNKGGEFAPFTVRVPATVAAIELMIIACRDQQPIFVVLFLSAPKSLLVSMSSIAVM